MKCSAIDQHNLSGYFPVNGRVLILSQKFRPYFCYNFFKKISGGWFARYFEYQVNPRSRDYLSQTTFLGLENLSRNRNITFDWHWTDEKKLPADLSVYDAVVLFYPDSLGLGFWPIERRLEDFSGPITAFNGRRRCFDFRLCRKKLYWHRFLEKTLLLEFLFSLLFCLLTPFYLLFSLFKPRPTAWAKKHINEFEYLSRQGKSGSGNSEAVENFWDEKPMTYGDEHGLATYQRKETTLSTKEFFEKLDQKFYLWNKPLHLSGAPFSKIFDYAKYKGKNVLEIGCGLGTMIIQWAKSGSIVSAVDLTNEAIEQTEKRFALFGLKGNFIKADGRALPFGDEMFDYVYSWGVLHHSSDLKKSISEIKRVLKKQGEAGLMLYNRDSFFHHFLTELREGWLHLESDFLSPLELASRYGDDYHKEGNPHTWPIKLDEINYLFEGFDNIQLKILGTDLDYVFWRMFPFVFFLAPKFVRKAYARRFGWSLWITAKKF